MYRIRHDVVLTRLRISASPGWVPVQSLADDIARKIYETCKHLSTVRIL
jgi:hypothetical protein